MKNIIYTFLFVGLSISLNAQNADYFLYVGTFTRKTSEGIYVYRFNTKTGDVTPASIAKGNQNPGFLALSPDKRFLYSVAQGNLVRAFSIDKTSGKLDSLNSQSSQGVNAVHLQVDKTGKWLIVGNYGSGSLCILPIRADGSLEKATQTFQMEGKSITPERQNAPHIHSINIAPNNKDVFVPDLGTDKIMAFTLNDQTGQLSPSNPPFVGTTAGAGPRHFAFHPNGKFAYVIQELNATITAFNYKNGTLDSFQTIKTLPDDYTGLKWAADIHISPDGKFLYGSNRAHESLAIFKINQRSGRLTLVGHQAINGKTPRNFAIDPTGNFILVANQDSDNITIFKRDKKTGKLTPTAKEISVSMPVCLVFYKL